MSDYWDDFNRTHPDMVSREKKGIMNQKTGQMIDNLQEVRALLGLVDTDTDRLNEPVHVAAPLTGAITQLAIAYALADIAVSLRTQIEMVRQPGTGFSAQR